MLALPHRNREEHLHVIEMTADKAEMYNNINNQELSLQNISDWSNQQLF